MSLNSISAARMHALGIKFYDTRSDMVSPLEQETQFEGNCFFVAETLSFWQKTDQFSGQISDYIEITPRYTTAITYTESGNKCHVSPEASPPQSPDSDDLWIASDTGHLYIRIKDSNAAPNWVLYEETNPIEIYDPNRTISYTLGELVIHNGHIYKNISGIDTHPPGEDPNNDWYPITSDQTESNWVSGHAYIVGDVVVLSGQTYRCIQDTSTILPGTNTSYWVPEDGLKKTALALWRSHEQVYRANDLVNFDGTVYKNLTGINTNITPPNDPTNWEFVKSNIVPYPPYDPGTPYEPGDKISGDGGKTTYIATGNTILSPGQDPSSWKIVSPPGTVIPLWEKNNNNLYVIDDIVNYEGLLYRNMTGSYDSDQTPDVDKVNWIRWENLNIINTLNNINNADSDSRVYQSQALTELVSQAISGGLTNPDVISQDESIRHVIPTWNRKHDYVRGDMVMHHYNPFVNISGHSTTKTPLGDPDNWWSLGHATIVWNPDYYYHQDDIIYYNGVKYIANIPGKFSDLPSANPTQWTEYEEDRANIRYYATVTDAFTALNAIGEDWSKNDIIIISSLNVMYRYTADPVKPFHLVQNTNHEIITGSIQELRSFFNPADYNDSDFALVRSINVRINEIEKPEYSMYKPNHVDNTWEPFTNHESYRMRITWKEWNTAWSYDPSVMELPVGSMLTVLGPERVIVPVENWDTGALAWDSGYGIEYKPNYDRWGWISQMDEFNDSEWDDMVSTDLELFGVNLDFNRTWGIGWLPSEPENDRIGSWAYDYDMWNDGRQKKYQYYYRRLEDINAGKRRGDSDMFWQGHDAPWIDMDLDKTTIRDAGVSRVYPEGYDQYFYGFSPSGLKLIELFGTDVNISYRYFNSQCLTWDGMWEKDRTLEDRWKVVPGSEEIKGVPRPNIVPKIYGNPMPVTYNDIEEIAPDECVVTYNCADAVADLIDLETVNKGIEPGQSHSWRMRVKASSFADSDTTVTWFDHNNVERTNETGRLKHALFFPSAEPRWDEPIDISLDPSKTLNITPREVDKRYWKYWNNVNDDPTGYFQFHPFDVLPEITFQMEDADENGNFEPFYFTGLNILPTRPYGAAELLDDSDRHKMLEFEIFFYDENDLQIDYMFFNTLNDSLREKSPNTITKYDTCSSTDVTIQINNRDFRAYRHAIGEDIEHYTPGGSGVEYRPGIECWKFGIKFTKWTDTANRTLSRLVPLISRTSTIINKSDTRDTDTYVPYYTGNIDMAQRYIKTGHGSSVTQPNSWRPVIAHSKPNEKVFFRDKVAPDPEALRRWPHAKQFFKDYMYGGDTDANVNNIFYKWVDNRPMMYEGENLDLADIHNTVREDILKTYHQAKIIHETKDVREFIKIMQPIMLAIGLATMAFGGIGAIIVGVVTVLVEVILFVVDTEFGNKKMTDYMAEHGLLSEKQIAENRANFIIDVVTTALGSVLDVFGVIGDIMSVAKHTKRVGDLQRAVNATDPVAAGSSSSTQQVQKRYRTRDELTYKDNPKEFGAESANRPANWKKTRALHPDGYHGRWAGIDQLEFVNSSLYSKKGLRLRGLKKWHKLETKTPYFQQTPIPNPSTPVVPPSQSKVKKMIEYAPLNQTSTKEYGWYVNVPDADGKPTANQFDTKVALPGSKWRVVDGGWPQTGKWSKLEHLDKDGNAMSVSYSIKMPDQGSVGWEIDLQPFDHRRQFSSNADYSNYLTQSRSRFLEYRNDIVSRYEKIQKGDLPPDAIDTEELFFAADDGWYDPFKTQKAGNVNNWDNWYAHDYVVGSGKNKATYTHVWYEKEMPGWKFDRTKITDPSTQKPIPDPIWQPVSPDPPVSPASHSSKHPEMKGSINPEIAIKRTESDFISDWDPNVTGSAEEFMNKYGDVTKETSTGKLWTGSYDWDPVDASDFKNNLEVHTYKKFIDNYGVYSHEDILDAKIADTQGARAGTSATGQTAAQKAQNLNTIEEGSEAGTDVSDDVSLDIGGDAGGDGDDVSLFPPKDADGNELDTPTSFDPGIPRA